MARISIELAEGGVTGALVVEGRVVEIVGLDRFAGLRRELLQLSEKAIKDGLPVRTCVLQQEGGRLDCVEHVKFDDLRFAGALRDMINRCHFRHGTCYAEIPNERSLARSEYVLDSSAIDVIRDFSKERVRWIRTSRIADWVFDTPVAGAAVENSSGGTCVIDISNVCMPDGYRSAMIVGENFYGSALRNDEVKASTKCEAASVGVAG